MLGIVVSLPWELKSLTRETIPVGAWKAISDHVLVALSGIGQERASAAASLLVARGATVLISWGSAAALDLRLRAGSLILPEKIIGADGEIFPADAEWHRRLYQTLSPELRVQTIPLAEGDAIVKTSAEKRVLAARTRAAVTDMESAAQARSAKANRVPFAAIRAIADTASTDIPESVLKALDGEGRVEIGRLLGGAALSPREWVKIVRLGLQFNAALRALKKAATLLMAPPAPPFRYLPGDQAGNAEH